MESGVVSNWRVAAAFASASCLARRVALIAAAAVAPCAGAVESAILVNPAPSVGAEMAYAIGVDGTAVVVGAPGENALGGAVYATDCAIVPCAAPVRIAPSDLVAGATFGSAVDIAGDTLVATSPTSEIAYVYIRDGSGWTEQARLSRSGGTSNERFGFSASLSADRLAIGADRAGNGAGAVYLFVRNGTTWSQEARLTASDAVAHAGFGGSVALDADTLLVGAPFAHASPGGSYGNGAAYVFTRETGGWTQQTKLVASPSANGDLFGFAVALAGDRAVVGAPYALSATGSAFVFARSGELWSQQAQLAPAAGAAGDGFGWSVAAGENVIVGAPFTGQLAGTPCGASYVFAGATLDASGAGTVAASDAGDLVGWAVAASGPRWVVSAPGYVVGTDVQAGAAYWFDAANLLFASGFETTGVCTAPEDLAIAADHTGA